MQFKELKQTFDQVGFLGIMGFLDNVEVEELSSETRRVVNEVVSTIPESEVYYEEKGSPDTLKQIQHLEKYDSYFERLAKSEKIAGLADAILGGPAILKNVQFFNKVPRIGKPTPAHQDGYYFMIKPQQAVTMWLSLGDADAENGAICYIPESHKKGMRKHGETSVLGFSQGITDWTQADTDDEVQMEASPGDILFHHSLTIHRANANESSRHRKSIGFIFYREDVEVDEEAHARYQVQLNATLKAEGNI